MFGRKWKREAGKWKLKAEKLRALFYAANAQRHRMRRIASYASGRETMLQSELWKERERAKRLRRALRRLSEWKQYLRKGVRITRDLPNFPACVCCGSLGMFKRVMCSSPMDPPEYEAKCEECGSTTVLEVGAALVALVRQRDRLEAKLEDCEEAYRQVKLNVDHYKKAYQQVCKERNNLASRGVEMEKKAAECGLHIGHGWCPLFPEEAVEEQIQDKSPLFSGKVKKGERSSDTPISRRRFRRSGKRFLRRISRRIRKRTRREEREERKEEKDEKSVSSSSAQG